MRLSRWKRRNSPYAHARRHPHRAGDRLRADHHRPGRRVRLRRHPGLPRPARGGQARRAGQLQPGHDHDRCGHGRPHLYRAADRGFRCDASSSASVPTACCHARRPDRPEPRRRSWRKRGVLDEYSVQLLGTPLDAIQKAEDREVFRSSCSSDRRAGARSADRHHLETRTPSPSVIGLPADRPPRLHPWRHRRWHRRTLRRAERIAVSGPRRQPDRPGAGRALPHGLERDRVRGDARRQRQLHHRLQHGELRPDGRPHRRLHRRRAQPDAVRRRIPDAAHRPPCTSSARSASRAAATSSSRSTSRPSSTTSSRSTRASAARSALASKATGYPIARVAAKIAIGQTLDELPTPSREDAAAFEPALDYVVVKIPRWPFDKFPTRDRTLGTPMKATGEVMAIGRTFEAALQKAMRSLEVRARRALARSALDRAEAPRIADSPAQRRAPLGALYALRCDGEDARSAARADRHPPLVHRQAARHRRHGAAHCRPSCSPPNCCARQAHGLLRRQIAPLHGKRCRDAVRAQRRVLGHSCRPTRWSIPAPPSSPPPRLTSTPPTSRRTRPSRWRARRPSCSAAAPSASVRASSSTTPPSTPRKR